MEFKISFQLLFHTEAAISRETIFTSVLVIPFMYALIIDQGLILISFSQQHNSINFSEVAVTDMVLNVYDE